jgi:hypothetical protein
MPCLAISDWIFFAATSVISIIGLYLAPGARLCRRLRRRLHRARLLVLLLLVVGDGRLDRVLGQTEQWIFTGGSASSATMSVFLIASA